MALHIKHDGLSLTRLFEPGITRMVLSSFEDRLQEKLNNAVNEIYEEMRKELPDKITLAMKRALMNDIDAVKMHITVDLTGGGKQDK